MRRKYKFGDLEVLIHEGRYNGRKFFRLYLGRPLRSIESTEIPIVEYSLYDKAIPFEIKRLREQGDPWALQSKVWLCKGSNVIAACLSIEDCARYYFNATERIRNIFRGRTV